MFWDIFDDLVFRHRFSSKKNAGINFRICRNLLAPFSLSLVGCPYKPGLRLTSQIGQALNVLKCSNPTTLAFAISLHLRSETRRSKAYVLWRRIPNGKLQKRLRLGTCMVKR